MLNIKSLIRLLCLSLMFFYCVPELLAQTAAEGGGTPIGQSVGDGITVGSGGSNPKPVIEISPYDGGTVTPKARIAISELAVLGGKPGNQTTALPDRLAANLDMTGLFVNMDRRSFLETDPRLGVEGQTPPNFEAWDRIGANYLVKGGISVSGSKLTLEMRLFNVGQRSQMLGKRYSGSAKEARKLINQFTNDLLEAITGTPGVFGSEIVFVTGPVQDQVIMVTELGGDQPVQVSKQKGRSTQPTMGPGGRTAWVHRNGDKWELLVDGKVVSSGPTHMSPAFRPDGTVAAAYSEAQKTSIYAFNGRNSKTLLSGLGGINVSPTFSPDGSRMAFASNQDGVTSIYIGSANGGGGASRLTSGAKATDPSWSPTGDFITFVTRETDICIIRPDGTGFRQLTGGQGINHRPSFSPDGRMIVFSSTRNGRLQLFVMSANGDNPQPLMPDNRMHQEQPYWCPTMPK